MNDIDSYLQMLTDVLEQEMAKHLPDADRFPQSLHRAMRYSVYAGGKRLRPALVLAVAEACGCARSQALPAACAIEFVHTYSLIHDDLPAMDDDDYRRGKLTNHRVFGEAIAILAGDALLTLAFQTVLAGPAELPIKVRLANELAQASGVQGMVGGQAADILQEGQPVDETTLQYIHSYKTGALLRAAVRMGAIVAGVEAAELQQFTVYAECIGLAFQIVDDILDVVGDANRLGKEIGADAAAGKATYPAYYGLTASRGMVAELTERAVAVLPPAAARFDPTHLIALAHWLRSRDH